MHNPRHQPKEFSKNVSVKGVSRTTIRPPRKGTGNDAYTKCMNKANSAAQKKACQALKP